MSTGKRLAKRSIIGTRVCAQGPDSRWYSGVILNVKTPPNSRDKNNCINLTPNTRYSVRFDTKIPGFEMSRRVTEFREADLIGPGFRHIYNIELLPGQKVFLTYNGRESSGEVITHAVDKDEVSIRINPIGQEVSNFLLSNFLINLEMVFYLFIYFTCNKKTSMITSNK